MTAASYLVNNIVRDLVRGKWQNFRTGLQFFKSDARERFCAPGNVPANFAMRPAGPAAHNAPAKLTLL